MYLTDEELESLITTRLYKYYKDYVEPLEIEHDELIDEVEKLKKKNKSLRVDIKKLKYPSEYDEKFNETHRELNKVLVEKNRQLQQKVELQRKTIERLKRGVIR